MTNFPYQKKEGTPPPGYVVYGQPLTILVNCIPSPQKNLETLRTGQFLTVSLPYVMTKIREKQNFVIFSIINLP